MALITRRVKEVAAGPKGLPLDELLAVNEPRVLRGLVSDWAITHAGRRSDRDAMDYIRSFYNGRAISASVGSPEIAGRLFYTPDFSALNFDVERAQLDAVLERIASHLADEAPPTIYVGSTLIDQVLPGFRRDNDLPFGAQGIDPPPSIWIGNRTIASCHYDAPNNIAACVVGRRRFTFFPPHQISNLYPGPLDPTPGGQAISLVDFENPDFDRFPRFRDALPEGQMVEVEPGDAVFIPSMWWHHVQGLSPFNVLVNYWWGRVPAYIPTPMHALYHAMWAIRDRPQNEKEAWRHVFEYYVFGEATRAGEPLPPEFRGMLGPIDENQARHLRALLLNKLNR